MLDALVSQQAAITVYSKDFRLLKLHTSAHSHDWLVENRAELQSAKII